MIIELTKNDFKSKYLGTLLGIFWAFFNPILTIVVFLIVFQFGFKSMPVGDYPFTNWLISGIISWFFFTESLGSGTGSIVDNSYLVKKVSFRVSLLPGIKLLSALIIHLFFIGVVVIINWSYGYAPSIYTLQIFYYLPAMILLLMGLTWLTSALYVFFRDTMQIVTTVVSLGFWLTPIFWSFSIVPEQYKIYFMLNPMVYIVEGYRSAFIYQTWFWENPISSVIFWIETLFILVIGIFVFRKLRPQFSDVI
ncbi:ABC transporter permease [Paenibacillus endoradicis]|uniref:ABC transporter permease n=1 Tax=Paenibacillus endoradicis TaxID=2972487 RepID=UPI00215962FC|nr:ABC transporter permease [Paenibacillus endoradicis]MCR8659818.1 ABC transporter permease [Paenibacillus endoradicis]